MLLTIATTCEPATDLGYLLAKHPQRCQRFDLNFGTAHVWYPQADAGRCEAALWPDVDPVDLVRGKGDAEGALSQYVNDRPYTASSFLSLAIARVYASALGGDCKGRPELAAQPLPLVAEVPVLRSRAAPIGCDVVSSRWGTRWISKGCRWTPASLSGATAHTSAFGLLPRCAFRRFCSTCMSCCRRACNSCEENCIGERGMLVVKQ